MFGIKSYLRHFLEPEENNEDLLEEALTYLGEKPVAHNALAFLYYLEKHENSPPAGSEKRRPLHMSPELDRLTDQSESSYSLVFKRLENKGLAESTRGNFTAKYYRITGFGETVFEEDIESDEDRWDMVEVRLEDFDEYLPPDDSLEKYDRRPGEG